MSEKWKYRVKIGGTWGILTAILTNLFKLADHRSFVDIFFSYRFLAELITYTLVGIFFFANAFSPKKKANK
ncbi:hypothetical protein [Aquimarina algiphila]|uniref:hypothetical protein n=1 Tax=Aquimarina algiphila TaxID=2047982 RepID=UPI00232E6769|nr:hypothetical protein [Aquimarina algiphila]